MSTEFLSTNLPQKTPWKEKEESTKLSHCTNLVNSLENLKNDGLLCDFLVKVGNESIPVHRAVLGACSGFFRSMFSSNMKEVHDQFVEMKEVNPEAVKQCIDYMYTGRVSISESNVEDLLHVSTFVQLESLSKHLFTWLMYNLSVENSIFVHKLASIYDCHAENKHTDPLKIHVVQFIRANMNFVMKEESFLQLGVDHVLHYILDPMISLEVQWKAVLRWINHKKERDFEDIIYNLTLSKWPLFFILKYVWKSNHKEMSVAIKEYVASCIFSNWKDLRNCISFDNCSDLISLTKLYSNHATVPKVEKAITEFISTNLHDAVGKTWFKELEYDKICDIFTMSSVSEELKWKAVKSWVKENDKDGETLHQFIKGLDLSKLSIDFIEREIIVEPLVKSSLSCMNSLLVFMCQNAKKNVSSKPVQSYCSKAGSDANCSKLLGADIALLSKASGIMCYNLNTQKWDTVALPENYSTNVRMAGGNGDLYLLSDNKFYLLSHNKWIKMPSLSYSYSPVSKLIGNRDRIYLVGPDNLFLFNKVMKVWTYDKTLYNYGSSYSLVASKDHSSICVIGGDILGKKVLEYLPTAQVGSKWESLPPMHFSRRDPAAAMHDGCLYVIGGLYVNSATNTGERFDPKTKLWSEIPLMTVPRRRFTICVANGNLYAVGGAFSENGKSRAREDSIEILTRPNNKWRTYCAIKNLTLPVQAVVLNH